MNYRIKCTIFTVILFVSTSIIAQVAQTKRLEIELKEEYSGQSVYLFGEKGLVLYSSQTNTSTKEKTLKFEKFDTDLKNQGSTEALLNYVRKSTSFIYEDEDILWYLYFDKKKGTFTTIEYDVKTKKVKRHNGYLIKKLAIRNFKVVNRKAYIAGIYKKKPFIAVYDFDKKSSEIMDLTHLPKKSKFIDTDVLDNPKQIHFIFTSYVSGGKYWYYLIPFDENGKQLSKLVTVEDGMKDGKLMKLGTCSTTGLQDGDYLVMGTYSDKNYSTAQGVYIAKHDNQNRKFIKFYNFLDFNEFTSYMSARKQKRIEKKKNRKKSRGKELKLNYRMVIHDAIEMNNQYIFVGEAYYPTYRTETYTTFVNGVATTQTRRVFDGYQYSHATIAAFDKNGEMLWSNSFEMWLTYKPFYVKKFLSISAKDGKVGLIFVNGSTIKSKSFVDGKVDDDRNIEIVKTGEEGDKLKWTSASDIEYWFGQTFVADGFQKIVNKEKKRGEKRRKVYFINKVEF